MPVLPQENFITMLKKEEEYCDATNKNITVWETLFLPRSNLSLSGVCKFYLTQWP
jgi:hypothetical protein